MVAAILGAAALAAGGPKLVAPTAPVSEKEQVVIILSSPVSIHVDGCMPVEFERKQGEVWVAAAGIACNTTMAATRVEGSLTLSSPPPPPGEYRAVVGFGTGCNPGMAFHLAGCKKLGVVRSEAFLVGSPMQVAPATAPPAPGAPAAPTAPAAPPQR